MSLPDVPSQRVCDRSLPITLCLTLDTADPIWRTMQGQAEALVPVLSVAHEGHARFLSRCNERCADPIDTNRTVDDAVSQGSQIADWQYRIRTIHGV